MASIDLCEPRELSIHAIPPAGTSAPVRETVQPRLAMTIFVLVCVFCMFATYLGQHSEGVATIWIGNGLLFAILIRQPRSTWAAYLLVGYCADTLGASLMNDESILSSLVVSACNTLEIALTAFSLHRWLGPSFKLSRPRPLFAFFGVGVLLAPAFACALSSLCLTIADHAPWWKTYFTWFLGDALGMAIVAPLVFTMQEPEFFSIFRRDALPKTLLILAVPIVATAMDFKQAHEPLPILMVPSLIFVTFRRGFPGAVMAVCLSAGIAISMAISGHGLMTLARNPQPLEHLVAVQVFIAATLFAIFPIAALLEQSQSLALSLKQSETRYMDLANTDALTGQGNRRAFDHRLETEWQRAAVLRHPLSLLSLDIDHFKAYNDLYGHIAGDDCLRRIASIAATALHQSGSARLYRIGGEEFAVILPKPDWPRRASSPNTSATASSPRASNTKAVPLAARPSALASLPPPLRRAIQPFLSSPSPTRPSTPPNTTAAIAVKPPHNPCGAGIRFDEQAGCPPFPAVSSWLRSASTHARAYTETSILR